jgi:hypothetical protein
MRIQDLTQIYMPHPLYVPLLHCSANFPLIPVTQGQSGSGPSYNFAPQPVRHMWFDLLTETNNWLLNLANKCQSRTRPKYTCPIRCKCLCHIVASIPRWYQSLRANLVVARRLALPPSQYGITWFSSLVKTDNWLVDLANKCEFRTQLKYTHPIRCKCLCCIVARQFIKNSHSAPTK